MIIPIKVSLLLLLQDSATLECQVDEGMLVVAGRSTAVFVQPR